MGIISVTLPADGSTATVSQYNTPINTITTAINGNLDSNNIASLSGTKLTAGTVPGSALDSNTAGGWNVLSGTYAYASNNGNKEFTVTVPADVTSTISPGMKMQFTRSTIAPTQSMSFTAASSQYATKASPTGISFTSAFTCEAWVYLNSYQPSNAYVLSRENGTSGWGFAITSSGQVNVYFGASSSFTNNLSYQSIPLKRWVHIAGVVTSVSSKTAAIYINGQSVPLSTVGSATTLVQPSSNLMLGAYNTPQFYFDGYISEARVWSAAQSQANIQANMAISLTGSETGLVALFQGNGNFNDKTSNANTLTASGGAIATQVANPYNNIEYAETVSVTYSLPNTTILLRAADNYNIPNMTLTNPQYSTSVQPYGYPIDNRRLSGVLVGASQATTTVQDLNGYTTTFTVPTTMSSIRVNVSISAVSSTAGTQWLLNLFDGSNLVRSWFNYTANGASSFTYSLLSDVPTTPGSHTYKLQIQNTGSNITTSAAGTGNIGELTFSKP